jgi:hypothetical protein
MPKYNKTSRRSHKRSQNRGRGHKRSQSRGRGQRGGFQHNNMVPFYVDT